MSENRLLAECWTTLNEALDSGIKKNAGNLHPAYEEMIRYQLGWNGRSFEKTLTGKRLRPLMLLLTVHALGTGWRKALPAAAAIELVHNFSLVHDDIQDKSETRRGRETVWVKWGEAQAINTGDAMLALANLEILSLKETHPQQIVAEAVQMLSQATFDLTKGQFLDLLHEKAEEVSLQDYFMMVEGKTGALFSACFGIGALLAGKEENDIDRYSAMGKRLGTAFQIQDDYLGIWGQDDITGKPSEADLLSRKKTYPVQYALEKLPEVREYWKSHPVFTSEEVSWIKKRLKNADIDKVTNTLFKKCYSGCMGNFPELFTESERSRDLRKLIEDLFSRTR